MRTRKVTIKDIAAEAGVSIALVSFVMNNRANGRETYRVNKDTAQRIMEVADRLNYRPNNAARTLRCGKTNTIGVIVADISNKFFANIARCIEDRANKYNYTVLFGSTDENPVKLSNLIEVFHNKGIDGLIIVPCDGSDDAIHRAVQRQIPVVLLDRDVPDSDISCVILNNRKAGAQATEALLTRGCRRIEMISHSMNLSNINDREEGYKDAMVKAGIGVDDSMIHRIRHDRLDCMPGVIAGARQRGAEGLLFATNTLALAGLKEIHRNGWHIPDDFMVASFDSNDAFEINHSDVVYIQQPIMQFGTEAVDLLLKTIERKDDEDASPARIILAPKLIEVEHSVNNICEAAAE